MATLSKFNAFVADLGLKVHNLNTDVLKLMLTNTLPVATNAIKTDITEIGAGNGYVAGGTAVTISSYAQTSGTAKLVNTVDTVFTASGGTIGPFRYAVLYNSTAGSGNLIGWYDYGAAITLNSGETFTISEDHTNGILTIA